MKTGKTVFFLLAILLGFAFLAEATIANNTIDQTLEINQVNSKFGISVEGVGDLNGDGYDDMAVGATLYDDIVTDGGGVFIYYGSATGFSNSPDTILSYDQPTSLFGYNVGPAGDLNGDGYTDLAVSAPFYSNEHYHQGAIFIYYGSASGINIVADLLIKGAGRYSELNGLSRGWGDLNGDGFDDLVVGGGYYWTDDSLVVFYGSASGIKTTPDLSINNPGIDSHSDFGMDAVIAGDLNGDGYDDVAVGAPGNQPVVYYGGAVHIYYGSASGLSPTAKYAIYGENFKEYFGSSVSAAGDVDGDGIDDLLVGSPKHTADQAEEGSMYIFFGTVKGPLYSNYKMVHADSAYGYIGKVISGKGDVNGDGLSDIITGNHNSTAFIFSGGNQLDTRIDLSANRFSSYYGDVSILGDINGDGFDDAAVGAINYENGQSYEGGVYIFYGGTSVPPSGNIDDGVDPEYEEPEDDGSDLISDDGKPNWRWKTGQNRKGKGIFRYKLDDNELQHGQNEGNETSYSSTNVLSEGTHTLYVQEQLVDGTWSAAAALNVQVGAVIVPTLNEWGIIIACTLIILSAFSGMRKRDAEGF